MTVQPVRHYDFKTRLEEALGAAGDRVVTIGVRIDGGPTDSNISFRVGRTDWQFWRVGVSGGRKRIDTWNLMTQIASLTADSNFPHHIQAVCERGINDVKKGWVILRVQSGHAQSAALINAIVGA